MQPLAGRQLYVCAGSILIGAFSVQGLAELPSMPVLLLATVLALPGFLFRPFQPLSWILLGFAWTVFRAGLVLAPELPPEQEGKDLVVEGVVTSLVRRDGPHLRFTLTTLETTRSGEHGLPRTNLLLRWYHADSDIRVGEGWRLTVRLKRPHGFQNPGGFDYEKYLFRHRLRATGYVRNAARIPEKDHPVWWQEARENLQHYLRASGLAHEGLIRALVIGDRAGVSDGQWQTLVRTGTLHLLAISGLHIGLVSGFCFVLGSLTARVLGTGLLWFPAPLWGAASAMLGGGLYALLAGLTIPTQRAFIMVVAVITAVLFRRSVDIARCLALALVLILIVDPLSVLDTGLWLSFGAVVSILLASRLTESVGSRLGRLILVQLLLTVFLAPLVLMFFGQVSLVAPLANLIAIPVVAFFVVPIVLVASTSLGVGWEGIAGTLYGIADYILGILLPILEFLSEPGWAVWVGEEYGLLMLAIASGILVVRIRRNRAWLFAGSLILLLLVPQISPPGNASIAPGEFQMTVLDVGQGLSMVVRTRNHVLLYDTGARFGPRFDAGSAVVVPYLRHQDVRVLDMLIVSHGDNDHIGGLESVLREFPAVRRLTSVPDKVPGSVACVEGDEWSWDGVRFTVLSPDTRHPPEHNNSSCVVKVTGSAGSALISGDIEKEVEALLIATKSKALSSDVLLVPHQGSKTSSTESFIDHVSPRIAIVASGYRNQYGHPAHAVMTRYRDRNIETFNTAYEGAVTARFSGGITTVDTFRSTHRRFWFDTTNRDGVE